MKGEAYVVLMIKQLSARGSLFLFVRTHHHLEYYFNLADIRLAANERHDMNRKSRDLENVVAIRRDRQAAIPRPS